MPLVFIPSVIFPFVFSKLVVFQMIIGITFPAYLTLAWIDPRVRPKTHPLYLALIVYFLALLGSVAFAVDPARAWWGNQERMNGLFTLLHFFVWLTMATGVLRRWDDWKLVLQYQTIIGALMGLVAVLQRYGWDRLFGYQTGDRVGGFLDNPIYMACYQIFNLGFLGLLALKRDSSWRWRIWYIVATLVDVFAFVFAQSRGAVVGVVAGLSTFAFFYAIFGTNKRVRTIGLGLLGVLVVGYGILFQFRHTDVVQHSALNRIANIMTSGGIETRFVAWRIAWNGFLQKPVFGWGLDNFHLLFNQQYNPQSLQFGISETWFDRAHNTVLDVLSMTGAVGAVTYAGLFIAIFWSVWRGWKRGVVTTEIAGVLVALPVAYFVQNLFVFDHPAAFSMSYLLFALIISLTDVSALDDSMDAVRPPYEFVIAGGFMGAWLAWRVFLFSSNVNALLHDAMAFVSVSFFLSGLVFVIVGIRRLYRDGVRPLTMRSWIPLFVVLALMSWLCVWRGSYLPFRASALAMEGNMYFTYEQGYGLSKKASAIWTPYMDEQVFLLARNLITASGNRVLQKIPHWKEQYALAKALGAQEDARHPGNTQTKLIYGRFLQEMGRYIPSELKEAERVYRETIATSPKRQQVYYALAALYLSEGRHDEAIELYKQAYEFAPNVGDAVWTYGSILFYDQATREQGARLIAQAVSTTAPYRFTSINDLLVLTDAYAVLRDGAGFAGIVDRVDALPPESWGEVTAYYRLARAYEAAQFPALRDRVLGIAFGRFPEAQDKDGYRKWLIEDARPTASSTSVQAR